MKAHDLIHGGLYLIGHSQIVRFYALNGGFYTLDGHLFGNPFADAESGEIECFTINKNWLKVSPIPLTPEILEKNGFEKKHPDEPKRTYWILRWKGGEVHAKMNRGMLYMRITGIPTKFGNFCPTFNGHIIHVHELQHALRLCGLTELADGLKV